MPEEEVERNVTSFFNHRDKGKAMCILRVLAHMFLPSATPKLALTLTAPLPAPLPPPPKYNLPSQLPSLSLSPSRSFSFANAPDTSHMPLPSPTHLLTDHTIYFLPSPCNLINLTALPLPVHSLFPSFPHFLTDQWPHCSLPTSTHSFTHLFTHSPLRSFLHSLTHSL